MYKNSNISNHFLHYPSCIPTSSSARIPSPHLGNVYNYPRLDGRLPNTFFPPSQNDYDQLEENPTNYLPDDSYDDTENTCYKSETTTNTSPPTHFKNNLSSTRTINKTFYASTSQEHRFLTRLADLLDFAISLLYLFDEIVTIILDEAQNGLEFSKSSFPKRKTFLKRLANAYNTPRYTHLWMFLSRHTTHLLLPNTQIPYWSLKSSPTIWTPPVSL